MNFWNLFIAVTLFSAFGCSSSGNTECSTNNDCLDGLVCIDGDCVDDPFGKDSDSDTNSDTLNDTESESDSVTDKGSDSVSDTGSDSDTTPLIECTLNDQCDDGEFCTYDWCNTDTFKCIHEAAIENSPCPDDGNYCNGKEKCIAGKCQGVAPCTGDEIGVYSCHDLQPGCDEANDECTIIDNGNKANGTPCSENMFCFGDTPKECQNGVCTNPAGAVDPCGSETSLCEYINCNETTDKCSVTAIHIGDTCVEDFNACQEGVCLNDGTCDYSDPCVKHPANVCMSEYCTDGGTTIGDYICQTDIAPNNTSCAPDWDDCIDPSKYEVGYCWFDSKLPNCIQPEDRPCNDIFPASLCTYVYACNAANGGCDLKVDNSSPDYTAVSYEVSCGQTVPFTNVNFLSRHYYDYGSVCVGGDYRGMELVVRLPSSDFSGGPRNVTIKVDNDTPNQAFQIMHLSDVCDPASCTDAGEDMLYSTGVVDGDVFVLEAGPGYPPTTLDVTVTCN